MSPEQLARKHYDHKVDIYSLGLILFELLVPFTTQMERIQSLSALRKMKFPPHFIRSPEYTHVCRMLSHDPKQRPETTEMLSMDFLQDLSAGGSSSGSNSGTGSQTQGTGTTASAFLQPAEQLLQLASEKKRRATVACHSPTVSTLPRTASNDGSSQIDTSLGSAQVLPIENIPLLKNVAIKKTSSIIY